MIDTTKNSLEVPLRNDPGVMDEVSDGSQTLRRDPKDC